MSGINYGNSTVESSFSPGQSYGTPPRLLDNLMQTESSGRPGVVNPVSGATGAYQFIPSTTAALKKQGVNFDPTDAVASRSAADYYLAQLYNKTGSWSKALAAYGGFVNTDPTAYVNKNMAGLVDTPPIGQGVNGTPTATQASPAIPPLSSLPNAANMTMHQGGDATTQFPHNAQQIGGVASAIGSKASDWLSDLGSFVHNVTSNYTDEGQALNPNNVGNTGNNKSLIGPPSPVINYGQSQLENPNLGQKLLKGYGDVATGIVSGVGTFGTTLANGIGAGIQKAGPYLGAQAMAEASQAPNNANISPTNPGDNATAGSGIASTGKFFVDAANKAESANQQYLQNATGGSNAGKAGSFIGQTIPLAFVPETEMMDVAGQSSLAMRIAAMGLNKAGQGAVQGVLSDPLHPIVGAATGGATGLVAGGLGEALKYPFEVASNAVANSLGIKVANASVDVTTSDVSKLAETQDLANKNFAQEQADKQSFADSIGASTSPPGGDATGYTPSPSSLPGAAAAAVTPSGSTYAQNLWNLAKQGAIGGVEGALADVAYQGMAHQQLPGPTDLATTAGAGAVWGARKAIGPVVYPFLTSIGSIAANKAANLLTDPFAQGFAVNATQAFTPPAYQGTGEPINYGGSTIDTSGQ